MGESGAIIVGAGLAGLSAARILSRARMRVTVLEASDGVGGRVRTDVVEGFTLDRGFQVLLDAYPEAKAQLDYPALDLHAFTPGALVRFRGKFHRVADPWRRPLDLPASALSPIGSLVDKLNVGRLRVDVQQSSVDGLFLRPQTSTVQRLRQFGFSEEIIDRFFRPFLGGIFLDRNLGTSSRLFDFVFRMFADGDTVLPAGGMQAIPEQLAADLPAGSVRLNSPVQALTEKGVRLESGEEITGGPVIIATDGPAAARLLGDDLPDPGSLAVTALYFAAARAPISDPILILDGEGRGPINNLCFPSQVVPGYAPANQTLVSASVLGDPAQDDESLRQSVQAQLVDWFGPQAGEWRHLRTYRIRHAQPRQSPAALEMPQRPVKLRDGLFLCGDHRENASINGAMLSGRRAAQAVIG
jgi:phytoene dehydrogenase-like protein